MRLLLALLALLLAAPAAAAPPPGDANRLLNRAMQELARYELEAGVTTLGSVLQLTPDDGFAHSRLAEALAVGLGRPDETRASYRALAAAEPERPILRVWAVRAEMAAHVQDKWVVAGRPWVREALEELDALAASPDRDVRYAALIATRDLKVRMRDPDGAAAAGLAAAALKPDRLQARVSLLLEARRSGDPAEGLRLCRRIIRDTPGAVEACSLLFTGDAWGDAGKERDAALTAVAKLADAVVDDPVLANEVLKFYGRVDRARLQAPYLERVRAQHPDFTIADRSDWWRSAPPPLATTLRRVRGAGDAALSGMARTPRDAPFILEEEALRAVAAGDPAEGLTLVAAAQEALSSLPYSPSATRPSTSFGAWSEARARDLGRMLALQARALRALDRDDDAWPIAHRAAWLARDGMIWIQLAQFAATRGDALLAVEADLEGLARLSAEEFAALPAEYRERAAARFVAANPHVVVAPDQAWPALLAAVGARRAGARAPRSEPPPRETHPLVGEPAPRIDVTTLAGRRLGPDALAGKVLVVDFWATWCGPCKRAMPELQRAHERLGDDAIFLALSVDEGRDVVDAFVGRSSYTFEVAHVGPAAQADWLVRGIPSTFVVDADGIVRHHHQGFQRGAGERIEAEVRALLGD